MNKFLKGFAAVVFVFAVAQITFAATFTVTKIADTNDGVCDADCSFREAIRAAVSAAGDDTVAFDGVDDARDPVLGRAASALCTRRG